MEMKMLYTKSHSSNSISRTAEKNKKKSIYANFDLE